MPERNISGAFLSPMWWNRLIDCVHADSEIGHVGRWSNLQLALFSEGSGGAISIIAGKIVAVTHDSDALTPEAVVMTGSARAWRAFLQSVPPPQHNDILAMDRRQADFNITGARDVLIRNLRFIELVMAKCREVEVMG